MERRVNELTLKHLQCFSSFTFKLFSSGVYKTAVSLSVLCILILSESLEPFFHSLCICFLTGFCMLLSLLHWLKGNFSWQCTLLFGGLHLCCLLKRFSILPGNFEYFKFFFLSSSKNNSIVANFPDWCTEKTTIYIFFIYVYISIHTHTCILFICGTHTYMYVNHIYVNYMHMRYTEKQASEVSRERWPVADLMQAKKLLPPGHYSTAVVTAWLWMPWALFQSGTAKEELYVHNFPWKGLSFLKQVRGRGYR